MLRHGQDHAHEDVAASATAPAVDNGRAARCPVDKAHRPTPMWMGRGRRKNDYFGNCPRSTCGRGERQRRGMIMREKA